MNAQATYLLVMTRMNEFRSEAAHARLAREADASRRSASARIADRMRRRTSASADETLASTALTALCE